MSFIFVTVITIRFYFFIFCFLISKKSKCHFTEIYDFTEKCDRNDIVKFLKAFQLWKSFHLIIFYIYADKKKKKECNSKIFDFLRYYSYIIIWWKPLFNVFNFALHAIPAYIFDSLAFIMGKKQKYTPLNSF